MIILRLQRLLCLGLSGQPSADLITVTARIWAEIIAKELRHDGDWENKVNEAFNAIEKSSTKWPLPVDILEAMPKPQQFSAPYHRPYVFEDRPKPKIQFLVDGTVIYNDKQIETKQ